MSRRSQAIAALKAKLDARRAVPAALPLLSEGKSYPMEFASSETVEIGRLRRIVDDAPLGRGFSFQMQHRRVFVYERDLRPGPSGELLVMA